MRNRGVPGGEGQYQEPVSKPICNEGASVRDRHTPGGVHRQRITDGALRKVAVVDVADLAQVHVHGGEDGAETEHDDHIGN